MDTSRQSAGAATAVRERPQGCSRRCRARQRGRGVYDGTKVIHRLDEGRGLACQWSPPYLRRVKGRSQTHPSRGASASDSCGPPAARRHRGGRGRRGEFRRWPAAGSLATRRRVLVDVIDLSRTGSLPAAGRRCPAWSAAKDATAAGASIGDRSPIGAACCFPKWREPTVTMTAGRRDARLRVRRTSNGHHGPQPPPGPRASPCRVGTLLLLFASA